MILSLRHRRQSGIPVIAALCFAAGVLAGALIAPAGIGASVPPSSKPSGNVHAADVVRVIDGDTFEARVAVWPGMDVTTRIRLRDIDAPEMKASCDSELTRAQAARDALASILKQGSVDISNIGKDKYPGRIDADVSTSGTANVSAALLERGVVRKYDGRKREGWCDR